MIRTITLLATSLLASSIWAQEPIREVFDGQYIVTSPVAAEWCDGDSRAIEECQTEEHGEAWLVTPLGDGYSVIRKGFDTASESPKIVPYDRSKDLCFSDFLDGDCSPNWVIRAEQFNDPLLKDQWALKEIKALESVELIPEIKEPVAVIDTGVDCSHPDINCLAEYNAVTKQEGPGKAMDTNGHGTHVASTIGSYCNNSEGVCGVSSGIPILACNFMPNGVGSIVAGIECIRWAREKGAKVINASWGCQGCYSKPLLDAIQLSTNQGLKLFVAAAGNSRINNDTNPHYPSNYSTSPDDVVLSVASINEKRERSSFSNYGLKTVDLSAPGESILAGYPVSKGKYRSLSGTSMASPHVAAVGAILVGLGEERPRDRILNRHIQPVAEAYTATGGSLHLLSGLLEPTPSPTPTPVKCQTKKFEACKVACENTHRCKCPKLVKCKKQCRKKFCPGGKQ